MNRIQRLLIIIMTLFLICIIPLNVHATEGSGEFTANGPGGTGGNGTGEDAGSGTQHIIKIKQRHTPTAPKR